MAAGVASVEALCAGADTAPVLGPEDLAPACAILGSAWTQPGATAGGLGLKRWSVASPWECSRRPAEQVASD
jgi:hypothetical protein